VAATGHDLVVTGATGYLGGRFLEALLPEVEGRVYVIGRSAPGRSLANRLAPLIAEHGTDRVVAVEWDLAQPPEAIAAPAREALRAARSPEFWHFAALVSFDPRHARATEDVNVGGTRQLLGLARGMAEPVVAFNFVGTAFDTGVHEAPADIPEDGDHPRAWHNPYERSKFHAASSVLASGLPCRLFKPSIVTDELEGDDARCDETIYGFAKVLHGGVRLHHASGAGDPPHVRFRGDPATHLNLVPVDVVVRAMLGVRRSTPADGRAYHLVNPRGTPLGESMAALAEVAGFTWSFVPERPGECANAAERVYYERLDHLYAPYLLRDGARFRTDNLAAALGEAFVASVPVIDAPVLRGLFRRYFRRRLGVEVRDGRVAY
jgi:nucleoside-diphosphate-sugar epimerase